MATDFIFTAWGECRNSTCKQEFAIAGIGGVQPEFDSEGGWEWTEYFSPMSCHPMSDIFEIPSKCPEDVKKELRAAFAVFWMNRAACAGRLRVALECLMNHLGVPKRKKDKNGRYSDLSLHSQIDLFAKKEPNVGSQLMALKGLGNSGSHSGDVSINDLLDAFEITEHALGEIVDKRSEKVRKLVKKLTKKHKK